jgi:hypothetical protein
LEIILFVPLYFSALPGKRGIARFEVLLDATLTALSDGKVDNTKVERVTSNVGEGFGPARCGTVKDGM